MYLATYFIDFFIVILFVSAKRSKFLRLTRVIIYKAQEEIETISIVLFQGKYRVYNSAIIIIIEQVN